MEEIISILESEKESMMDSINDKVESIVSQYPSMTSKLTEVGLDMSSYASAIRKLFQGIEVSFVEIGYESLPKFIVDSISMAVSAVEYGKEYTTYQNTVHQDCSIIPKFDWYHNIECTPYIRPFYNMANMLYSPTINITKSTTDLSYLFYRCEFIKLIEGIDAIAIKSLWNTFYNCRRLKKVYINSDMSQCTNFGGTFSYCEKLTDINISSWNIDASKITTVGSMFTSCKSIPSSTLKVLETWNLNNITSCPYLFTDTSIDTINLTSWNVSKCTDFTSMFKNCVNLTSVNLTGWVFKNNCAVANMFNSCSSLASFDFSSITFESVKDAGSMLYGCVSLTSLDISSINTSGTNISCFISLCANITTVTGTFDYSSTTTMYMTFQGCNKLKSLTVANTSNVTNMKIAFQNCFQLETISGTIDMSSCTDATNMFNSCSALKNITLTNIKTSLSLSYSSTLSYTSILGIVNNLDDTVSSAKTLTLSSGAMALLTQSQLSNIESIIDELDNWNVVY